MQTLQKSKISYTEYVDYIPAELKENKTWTVVYHVKHPITQEMERVRHRVKPMKNITQRRRFAKIMASNINKKLATGWNKFIEESDTKSFAKLFNIFDIYLDSIKKQVKKEVLRKDTLRAYTSYINNLKSFLTDRKLSNIFVFDWKQELIQDFLDEIFFDRDNSARTHNNYLRFIKTFSKWMIKRKYINVNPAFNIDTLKESAKKRILIPKEVREEVFDYLKKDNIGYYTLCQTIFYMLIRRTEMTKLKVSDIYLKNKIINIRPEVSKTDKEQVVTIPKEFFFILATHISSAKSTDYLFSKDGFKPGTEQLEPKSITDKWGSMRKKLNLNKLYQWYSLKDTGITNYLSLGIPSIDVKNQARHHSLKQTEAYTPKNIIKSVSSIELADINF